MPGHRFLHLEAADTALVIDTAPAGGGLPAILHFGAPLGPSPDLAMLAASQPSVRWGARPDQPQPTSLLPGLASFHFGLSGLPPHLAQCWQYDGTAPRPRGHTLTFSLRGGTPATIAVDVEMSPAGVLAMRTRATGLAARFGALPSLALVLPGWASDVLSFTGDWAREFSPRRTPLPGGAFVMESRRGRGGHDRFPGLFIGEPGFGDSHGGVYGITLAWSGNHRISAEMLREGDVVVQAGSLRDDGGATEGRETGAPHEGPWAYATYSPQGLNGAMQAFHRLLRGEILPRSVAARPRPVHFNTWEAVYFRHDNAVLGDLVRRAAAVGAERFVLDDGWFRGRHDDTAGLGDWTADPSKYPEGLGPLIRQVEEAGLSFGLWVEPEMANPDSDLARAHPDWLRHEADGSLLLQRKQAVIDLTIPEAAAHVLAQLDGLLANHRIAYLKWDMNRDVTGVSGGGHPAHDAQVLAVHALIDRLRAAHPGVEIESCASGGGRCDYGMMARAERVWVSDSNDALDRFDIQRHANLFLPPEVSGVHVGPASCHITGRRLSLDLRAHVALFGHMGLELDLRNLDATETARLALHIANYKRFRALVHGGVYWRCPLPGPDHGGVCATLASGDEALMLVVRHGSAELGRGTRVRFPGLAAGRVYQIGAVPPFSTPVEQTLAEGLAGGTLRLSERVLSGRGMDLFLPRPETSVLIHLKAV